MSMAELDQAAATELFGVVDLLDSNVALRRSLSEPSAAAGDRIGLARKLLASRISSQAMSALEQALERSWRDPRAFTTELESVGVRGLLTAARSTGRLDAVQTELDAVAGLIESHPRLADALRNHSYPFEARQELLLSLTRAAIGPITQDLVIRATSAHQRDALRALRDYSDMAAQIANEQVAQVTVAKQLDATRIARLRAALETQLDAKVWLQFKVDPDIIGGMRIQFADSLIESTVAGRLEDARRLMTTK